MADHGTVIVTKRVIVKTGRPRPGHRGEGRPVKCYIHIIPETVAECDRPVPWHNPGNGHGHGPLRGRAKSTTAAGSPAL